MDDKLLRRMRHLLAMSQDKSSENEAMIAMRRLHSLLAKHNISLTELERDEEEINQDSSGSVVDWPWKRVVFSSIAKLYFCSMYRVPLRKNYADYFIMGTESNRTFALAMAHQAVSLIEREAKKECKAVHGKVVSNFISSFHNGAAQRVYERCDDLIDQAIAGTMEDDEGTTLPALVSTYLVNQKKIEEFAAGLGLRTKKTRTKARNQEAINRGRKAGDRVGLNRGIHGAAAPKMIGG